MLRITKESEYAFLLLGELIDIGGVPKSAAYLAQRTGIAAPITGKVLKRLVSHRVLVSTRGARGGYQLARSPEQISALEVVQAIEGTPELVDCIGVKRDCKFIGQCRISPFWQQLNSQITQMLAASTLAGMLDRNPDAAFPVSAGKDAIIQEGQYV